MAPMTPAALLVSMALVAPVQTLMLVGGGYHDYEREPRALAQALQRELPLAIEITSDLGALSPERITRYGLLMLNTCEQTELSGAQKTALLEAVRGGTPLVAQHCTLAAFEKWPQFHEMLGGYVKTHARHGPMCVEITDRESPLTAGLPAKFEFPDEPYFVERRDPADHVLARTCTAYEGRSGPEPHVWTKTYGKGRVFVMAWGHDAQAQGNSNVERLLENGVRWALGRTD